MQKNSYKIPFLKSYSFSIDNIELLLILVIRSIFTFRFSTTHAHNNHPAHRYGGF